jgi:hypothetical protein
LPDFDAARFEPGAPIDNPYFPLIPGTILTSQGSMVDEDTGAVTTERNDVFVTFETKEIEGVTATVVRDTVYADRTVPVEDTLDYYAQDTHGNVWYLGELSFAYEYDEDGHFIGSDTEGSWQAGVDGAQPGYIMLADPQVGDSYFNEFSPGVAVDQSEVVGLDQSISIGLGTFDHVLQTLDTTPLEPGAGELKYYAPGVGLVLTQEGLDEQGDGEPDLSPELIGVRTVTPPDDGGHGNDNDADAALSDLVETRPLDPGAAGVVAADDFLGDGSGTFVTFLAKAADFNDAIGAYTFDAASGEIGEGRILFPATDDLAAGSAATVEVADGEGLGLFLVPDGGELGLDLSAFEDGGLFFTNFLSGEAATLGDRIAPLVTDEEGLDGEVLPITALHALGGDDGFNFLNPAAGVHAVELDSGASDDDGAGTGEVEILGFEDLLTTDPGHDGDFNDVVVAVSNAPLASEVVTSLLGELGSADAAEAAVA